MDVKYTLHLDSGHEIQIAHDDQVVRLELVDGDDVPNPGPYVLSPREVYRLANLISELGGEIERERRTSPGTPGRSAS